MTHKNRELAAAPRVGLGLLSIVQVAFAFLAAWDLWHRPAKQVNGSKAVWAPVLLINWLGPAAYFLSGVKYK
jgi:hypothetical protein